jgi:serine/threonine-protein kinase
MSLRTGERFGRYEIAALLGTGGMGEVYRARDAVLHREVALKVLHPSAEGTGPEEAKSQGASRIMREARAAAALTHPNAVAVYDVGETDGVPFLAMELVIGRPLRAFIGDKTISLGRRLRWLAEIARALGAAHSLGLVHRDVKPENVIIRSDGVAKVLDFGIARQAKTAPTGEAATIGATNTTMTVDGVVVGTPLYMAPEQMRGEPLDGRADQFAWGVVAYELLTGELPWNTRETGLQLVSQILSGTITPPREKNAELSALVDAVVRRALAKAPKDRFVAMEDVAAALDPETASGALPSQRSHPSLPWVDSAGFEPTQALPSGAHAALVSQAMARASGRRRWLVAGGVLALAAASAS